MIAFLTIQIVFDKDRYLMMKVANGYFCDSKSTDISFGSIEENY